MNNITLGQISEIVIFVVGLIGGFKTIKTTLTKSIDKTLQPLNTKIDNLEMNSIKTDLVNFMALVENGQVSQEQLQNAYELFDRYSKLGGNSYIHDKWERLKKEGKI
mgnify:CR=1 FL=1